MSEITLDYMAWAVVAAFYSFVVTPMFGSMFDKFGGYTSHLKIGMTINAVLAVIGLSIFALLWAIARILE